MNHCGMNACAFLSWRSPEFSQDLQDGNDLDEVKGHVVQLRDEDRGHTLEQSSSVHVDRRSDGKDETADALRHAIVLLHTLHHQGQGGRAKEQETGGMCMKATKRNVCVFVFGERNQQADFHADDPQCV